MTIIVLRPTSIFAYIKDDNVKVKRRHLSVLAKYRWIRLQVYPYTIAS